jgi:hypothetical protein
MKNISKLLDITVYLSGENVRNIYLLKINKDEMYGM